MERSCQITSAAIRTSNAIAKFSTHLGPAHILGNTGSAGFVRAIFQFGHEPARRKFRARTPWTEAASATLTSPRKR